MNLLGNPSTTKNVLKTKIKSYGHEATDLHDKEMPRGGYSYVCLVVIVVDSVFKRDGNYYRKVCLEKCKYFKAKKR